MGDLLDESVERWSDIEGHLAELGGEAFCYQYLQGEYSPPKTGQVELPEKDGLKRLAIGNFDPTWVTSIHLAKLRELFDERRKAAFASIPEPLKDLL